MSEYTTPKLESIYEVLKLDGIDPEAERMAPLFELEWEPLCSPSDYARGLLNLRRNI